MPRWTYSREPAPAAAASHDGLAASRLAVDGAGQETACAAACPGSQRAVVRTYYHVASRGIRTGGSVPRSAGRRRHKPETIGRLLTQKSSHQSVLSVGAAVRDASPSLLGGWMVHREADGDRPVKDTGRAARSLAPAGTGCSRACVARRSGPGARTSARYTRYEPATVCRWP